MKLITRRIILGIGAALLVGGWGLTRYAHEQQESVVDDARDIIWVGGDNIFIRGSRTYFGAGVASMAIGAGLIGFGVPKGSDQGREEGD
jgi:hypothetical protein